VGARDPHDEAYRRKLTTPEDAVAAVGQNALVTFGPIICEPPALLWALTTRLRTGEIERLRVFSGPAGRHSSDSLLAIDLVDQVEHLSHFVGSLDRGKVAVGLGGYLPNHYHQLPRLITDYMQIDVALVSVSPMDRAGFFTLGPGNDFIGVAARHARRLVVEVNDQMPRVHGNSRLHVSDVDAIVECSTPFVELPAVPSGPEDDRIADAVAALVADGATLQIGVGAIPDAVCARLHGRSDLGSTPRC
jgi:itaconate CoA-transferase